MTTVLVTGGTGFIGRPLVQALLARGDRVRCLVRASRPPDGAEPVPGDITQPNTLPEALRGVDVVYHLAGATLVWHPVVYRRANALGTRNLARACAEQPRPPLVVYLSSLAAAGPAVDGRPRTEDDPPRPASYYGRSKLGGERALAEVADRVPGTVVRACATVGPGDPNGIRLFQAAKVGVNGVPGTPDFRLAMIYVEDVVRALLLAADRGARLNGDGRTGVYFAAMERQATLGELGQLAGDAIGNPRVKTVGLPRWFARLWGGGLDLFVAVTGQKRLLTTDRIREAYAGSWTCRTDKARDELGFTCQVGLADGFARTVAWYRAHGWL
ncbi:MAG: NAD-dependent epimerase/dehydratase family protein [Gemmataceae bacterium]